MKKKICKGNYRSEHFEGCNVEQYIFKFGLCKTCYMKFILDGSESAKKEIKKATIKAKTDIKRKKKYEYKKRKEGYKSLTGWKNDMQRIVNWIVRKIDEDYPCISHPKMKRFLRYDAGHYWGVGAYSDLRYNFHNIHKQNSQANMQYGGGAAYMKGILERYGQDYVDLLNGLPLRYKGLGKEKFTIENIRDEYIPLLKIIKKDIENGGEYTRDELNKLLGIYN